MKRFTIHAAFEPAGDQPQAIDELVDGIESGLLAQTLLGVTGSGKTFTVAHVIERIQRPAIVLAPNKTLAAQLYGDKLADLDALFGPIDHAAVYLATVWNFEKPTKALLERPDAIVVATVSAIYGLGDPGSYLRMVVHIDRGDTIDQRNLLRRLAELQYQ